MQEQFNLVETLERAGISDFTIDHDIRAVYVLNLRKLTDYLEIELKPSTTYIQYEGWNIVEGFLNEIRMAI